MSIFIDPDEQPRESVSNAADKEQVAQAQKEDEWHQGQILADMLEVLNMPKGVGYRIIWLFLNITGVLNADGSFSEKYTDDQYLSNYYKGRRSSGYALLSLIKKIDPHTVYKLFAETDQFYKRATLNRSKSGKGGKGGFVAKKRENN